MKLQAPIAIPISSIKTKRNLGAMSTAATATGDAATTGLFEGALGLTATGDASGDGGFAAIAARWFA